MSACLVLTVGAQCVTLESNYKRAHTHPHTHTRTRTYTHMHAPTHKNRLGKQIISPTAGGRRKGADLLVSGLALLPRTWRFSYHRIDFHNGVSGQVFCCRRFGSLRMITKGPVPAVRMSLSRLRLEDGNVEPPQTLLNIAKTEQERAPHTQGHAVNTHAHTHARTDTHDMCAHTQ